MRISKEDIQHIAKLAHISLSIDELDKYQHQLTDILDYVEQLNEVDTKNVKTTSQVGDLENVWREDRVEDWDREEVNLALAQGDLEAGHIKVKKVL